MKSSEDGSPYDDVPQDFPAPIGGAVAGMHPKLSMIQYQGRYYQVGNSPPERYERWRRYEEMAYLFVQKCLKNEHGKYAHLTQQGILAQYLDRLIELEWGSPSECRWMIRRTAEMLCWLVPDNAKEPGEESSAIQLGGTPDPSA